MLLPEIRAIDPAISHLTDKECIRFLAKLLANTTQQIKKANNAGIAVKVTNPSGFYWTWLNPYRMRFSKIRYTLYVYRSFSNPNRKLSDINITKKNG